MCGDEAARELKDCGTFFLCGARARWGGDLVSGTAGGRYIG
jgi:hypothetical protein